MNEVAMADKDWPIVVIQFDIHIKRLDRCYYAKDNNYTKYYYVNLTIGRSHGVRLNTDKFIISIESHFLLWLHVMNVKINQVKKETKSIKF